MSETPQKYDADADLIRVVAAFFVVMIHAADTRSFAAVAWNCVARFSVPLFILLSGYYMLSRPISGKRIAAKCASLFALIIVWSGIFFVYDLFCGIRSWPGFRELVTFLLTQPFHLWYLWALIALYLFTPALQVFCEHAPQRIYQYTLLLCFLFGSPVTLLIRSGIAPTLAAVVDRMKIPYLLGFVFCFLLGGYFRKWGCACGGERTRLLLYALGIFGTACTVLGTRLLSADGALNDLLMSFFAPNVLFPAATVFVAIKQWGLRRLLKPSPVLRELSACTLGTYLLHPMLLWMIQRGPLQPVLYGGSDRLFVPVRTVLVFVTVSLATMVLRRVPLLRRLVHLG